MSALQKYSHLTRFNQDGTLDTTFGKNGNLNHMSLDSIFDQIVEQSDGKVIVLRGMNSNEPKMYRIKKNGFMDLEFDIVDLNAYAIGKVVVDHNDNFYLTHRVANTHPNDFAILIQKYSKDGDMFPSN